MSNWIRNSEENNGILVVITLPSGKWIESVLQSSERQGESPAENAFLVIFSDDGRGSTTNQSLNQGKLAWSEFLFFIFIQNNSGIVYKARRPPNSYLSKKDIERTLFKVLFFYFSCKNM